MCLSRGPSGLSAWLANRRDKVNRGVLEVSRTKQNPFVLSLSKDRSFLSAALRKENRPFDKLRAHGTWSRL